LRLLGTSCKLEATEAFKIGLVDESIELSDSAINVEILEVFKTHQNYVFGSFYLFTHPNAYNLTFLNNNIKKKIIG
jgi:hypothetical protein